jgi:hypothetical protein
MVLFADVTAAASAEAADRLALMVATLQLQQVAQVVLIAAAAVLWVVIIMVAVFTPVWWRALVLLALCASYTPAQLDHFLQLARVICNGLIYSH